MNGSDCLFCKIGSGEIEANIVYETDEVIAFRDINPQAPTHALIIPKRHIATINELEESDAEIVGYVRAISEVCKAEGVTLDAGEGFRMIANAGAHGVQEVPHLHVHILGGRPMGRMVARPS